MASTIWRGYITFGLISIPVRLFRAARAERVSLRRLYRTNAPATRAATADENEPQEEIEEEPLRPAKSVRQMEPIRLEPKRAVLEPVLESPPATILEPVRQASVRSQTDEVLPERAVVKGYEYDKNQFVALEPDELKSIAPKTATEMEIQEFVSLSEVDPLYFETSYYVVPEEAGEKAYALLYRSLQNTQLVAVAQFAMHSREHVVVLRPAKRGLIAHTMFFQSEVRADEEFRADTSKVTDKELKLAEMLIHSLTAEFTPEKYHDTYREKLEALIANKVAGQPAAAPELPVRSAAVIDITEALQRSLAALKKPAASEETPQEQPKAVAAPAPKKTRRAGGRS